MGCMQHETAHLPRVQTVTVAAVCRLNTGALLTLVQVKYIVCLYSCGIFNSGVRCNVEQLTWLAG